MIMACLASGLWAADAWLPLFPSELGQRITRVFLQVLLIGYLTILIVLPALLILSIWLLLRSRSRGRRRPVLARATLLVGSGMIAVIGMELTAAAWLAWVHRMPRLPVEFPSSPPRDASLSLVVIGGSSALGYPYDPNLSVGQIVAWQMELAVPARRVELDIRAKLGRNLEDMHNGLASLIRRPDAMVIYSGHNEFLSRFETSRDAGRAEIHEGAFLQRLYSLSLRSPFCLWVYEIVRKHRLGGPPPPVNRHRLIDAPSFTRSERIQTLGDFRRRLEAIVAYCERIGAVPILVIPPSNESGYEPNRTVLSARATPEREAALSLEFQKARELEEHDPAASVAGYKALLSGEPEFAEAHFRLGRLLERSDAFAEARDHYIMAKDLDGFPVRCPSDFARVYHEVAALHDCILIDAPDLLRGRSAHGILDDSLFHDAHHPSFGSHLAIAQAIMDQLRSRRALGMGADGTSVPPIDPAECAAHFKVDSGIWAAVCIKSGTYFKHLASARYDPSERLAKSLRFMKAGEQLRGGKIKPEDAGIPGLGLSPSGTLPFDWWIGAAFLAPRNPGDAGLPSSPAVVTDYDGLSGHVNQARLNLSKAPVGEIPIPKER
jgi:hypothetical protein